MGTEESNVGDRFDRLPQTESDRVVDGRASRQAVLDYFDDRFGIPPSTFDAHTFWEKGAGKIWVYAGESLDPVAIESLGMTCLRTRQQYWKPTTDFVQRFGRHATECVIELSPTQARTFITGEEQPIDWDGDWGYLIAAHDIAGECEPIGVGLYTHGTLQSMIPKGRRRTV